MKKRIFAGIMWFVLGWYAGAVLAFVFGISPLLAPIIGVSAALLIAGDPRGVIWSRKPQAGTLRPQPNPA
jgi:hypothetical protein